MKKVLSIFLMYGSFVSGQQVIGSFPSMNGGFEGLSPGYVGTTLSPSNWSSDISNSMQIITSGGRSGNNYAYGVQSGTTAKNIFRTAQIDNVLEGNFIIQFYYRGDKDGSSASQNLTTQVFHTVSTTVSTKTSGWMGNVTDSNWTKKTYITQTSNLTGFTGTFHTAIRLNNTCIFDIDDYVVYPGTVVDIEAPDAPVSFSAISLSNQNDISWTAPPSGVDGGGYMVVRYTIDPTGQPHPNVNGIYAVGNSIGTGGTVVYLGTNTSYSDTPISQNTNYYYRIYTVDKAFNYSSPIYNSTAIYTTAWSNSSGPTVSLDAVISGNLTTTSDLACKDLTINSGNTLTIGPGKKLTVTGNLINNGTIVFKSDATGTAMFDVFNGSQSGTGVVTVERFIPQGKRAFRLLSPAVTTTTFILDNWQQGTHITGGLGTGSLGFDATETNNPSMFTYNNQVASGSGWTAIANTNATKLRAGVGYRMLVRGDRTASNITAASADNMNAAITLSATGTLKTGTVTLNSSSTPAINNTSNTTTADYSLVGNPYQSAVDWNAVTKSGIDATYWAWDPNMGTSSQRGRYVAYNGTTNDNASSQVGQYIQPGQAFFVKNTVSGTAGTLTFQEAHKATTTASVFRMTDQTPSSTDASISMQLYDPNELAIGGYPIDAMKALFNAEYQNTLGTGDATKLESAGENIAWFRNNTKLAIDAAAPLSSTDELLVKTLRLSANKNYTLKVQTSNFDANLTPYLVDNFLNTQTEISTSQAFLASFATTTNAASYNEDRFKIVFTTSALHNDTFTTQIGLYPNPSKGNVFNLQLPSSAEVSVKLFNTLGQEIGLTNNGNTYQAVQSLPTGMYYIKVTQGTQTTKLKWIVE